MGDLDNGRSTCFPGIQGKLLRDDTFRPQGYVA
jgi:hypothetical protein